MQEQNQILRNYKALIDVLVAKMSRLRKRLMTCGYSMKQVTDIILMQFLKLPKIDWKDLDETNNLYEVKSVYKVDSSSAEIIMRLQKIVPQLHTFQVCQYLLHVLQINASGYGFNLEESSSDSDDSNSGMRRFIARWPKKRFKTAEKKQELYQKAWKDEIFEDKSCKKVHFDFQYYENKKAKVEADQFFRSHEMNQILLPFQDEQFQKEMKRMPESEDSDNQ